MTDITSHVPSRPQSRRSQEREYLVYFGLIFVAALPFACLSCLRDVLTGRTQRVNPLVRARRDAARVAPMIFSA